MAETDHELKAVPERAALPTVFKVNMADGMPPHSPAELEQLEQETGKTFEQLGGTEASTASQERLLIYFGLRRLGYEPTWEEAGHVLLDYQAPDPLDDGS